MKLQTHKLKFMGPTIQGWLEICTQITQNCNFVFTKPQLRVQ